MAQELVNEELWKEVEPLLPEHRRSPQGGRPPAADRPCLEGILYVLKTGCQWQMLPASDRWPSGSTCWRRWRDWTQAGLWPQLHRRLLNRLGQAGQIDQSVAIVDSASVRAKKGASTAAPTPRTARKTGANGTSSATSKGSRW